MEIKSNAPTAILLKIDKQIDDLVKNIDLLSYVNPLNLEEEKEKFFLSKYLTDPVFKYPKPNFDRFALLNKLYAIPVKDIKDDRVRAFYQDTIDFYSGLLQAISSIGHGNKFYYNSLKSYGTPTEKDVLNAKFILHFDDEGDDDPRFELKYTCDQAIDYFKAYSERYDFDYNIKVSDKISAEAMVINSSRTLLLNSNCMFSDNELELLSHHEIGVHMVTTMNGLEHPLKVFSHGFPNNEETQEGLAVLSEYMSNNLTVKRLKELAYRVIAVDSLAKGYTFYKTFRLLHNQYDLDRDKAFNITVRAHRGGGFTKDFLYLTGLKKVYDYYTAKKDLSVLLTGKVTLAYTDEINYFIENKLAVKARHITDSYLENNNTNTTVNFILNNLK